MHDLLRVLLVDTIGAGVLGLVALLVWRLKRSAPIAHGICLLALLKLVTPPLFELNVLPETSVAAPMVVEDLPAPPAVVPAEAGFVGVDGFAGVDGGAASPLQFQQLLFALWAFGSLAVLVLVFRRARRFSRLLDCADTAPAPLCGVVRELSGELGLARVPRVVVVNAQITPNLFALARRPVIVLPRGLLDRLGPAETRTVLAHELCHLANRDHLTRWLECLVVVLHWWNPIAHLIRRLIREIEELRCDARAVDLLGESPRRYGRTILEATAHLASAPVPLPLGASGLGGAQSLRRRLTMIAEHRLAHRLAWPAKLTLALGATGLLPLGQAAQERKSHEVEVDVVEVEAGEMQDDLGRMLKKVEQMLEKIGKRVRAKNKKAHSHDVHDVHVVVPKGSKDGVHVVSPDGKHKVWLQAGKGKVRKIQLGKGKAGGGVHGEVIIVGPDGKKRGVHGIAIGGEGHVIETKAGNRVMWRVDDGKHHGIVLGKGDKGFDVDTIIRTGKGGKAFKVDVDTLVRTGKAGQHGIYVARSGKGGANSKRVVRRSGKAKDRDSRWRVFDVEPKARKRAKPEKDVDALRRRVRQLERQLRELKRQLGRRHSL